MKPTLTQIIKRLEKDHKQLEIKLFEGASDAEIEALEVTLKSKLPKEIKKFYKFTNGFAALETGFRMIPLHEINQRRKNIFLFQAGDFDIAEHMNYSNIWTVSRSFTQDKYTIYNHGGDLVHLTDSLATFIDIYLDHGVYHGLAFWKYEIKMNL